jgi:hypothetical protein
MDFDELDVGECRATHVQPFSTDMHLFGVECKQSWWLAGVLVITVCIKLFQNMLYTKIGQLQRELLQMDREERSLTTPKVLELLGFEFIAGVIGIISVLVITGNNAIIWITIIIANCAGTVWAYTHVEADHHSTALEMINMLNKRDGNDEEAKRAREAIEMLKQALQGDPVVLKRVEMSEMAPLVRKRLLL